MSRPRTGVPEERCDVCTVFFVLSAGVGIAQSVERWIVVPVVEGSSPFAHPPLIRLFFIDKMCSGIDVIWDEG